MKQISAYFTLILAVAFTASPLLTDPFTGFTADQLPIPQINPPVQPAGYAFAIWGVIYIWLIVSALFGALKRRQADDWHKARLPLMISLTVGVPWLAIANTSAIWATVSIWIMAVSAIYSLISAPTRDRWLFQAPTALYAGWLTAASCVSFATVMAGFGILTGAGGWAVIGILLGLTIAWATNSRRRNAPEYLLAVIWALIGIIVANWSSYALIAGLATLGVAALAFKAFTKPAD